jgi:hypothetical protein
VRWRSAKFSHHAFAQSFGIALTGLCEFDDPVCEYFIGKVAARRCATLFELSQARPAQPDLPALPKLGLGLLKARNAIVRAQIGPLVEDAIERPEPAQVLRAAANFINPADPPLTAA